MQRTIRSLAVASGIAISLAGCGGGQANSGAGNGNSAAVNSQTAPAPQGAPPAVSSPVLPVSAATSTPCTEAKKPVITKPVEGATVTLSDFVRGTTPCPGMRHYAIVTPPDGDNWVQNPPFNIDASGSFSSDARFGEGSVGAGNKFIVRILVTKAALTQGKLRSMPADAILSDPVSVTRKQ